MVQEIKTSPSSEIKNSKHKTSAIFTVFRTAMVIIGSIFLIWFILPFIIYGIINPYNLFGIIMSLFVIVYFGAKPLFKKLRNKFYQNTFTKTLWKTGRFLIYAFAVYAFITSILMAVFASIPPSTNASAIILGAQVKGTSPSLILYDRIAAGTKFLEDNPEAICVATGGLGDTASITEAQCMYNVLTQNGIDKNRIFLEEKATNTQENILYSYNIIKEQNKNTDIAIVSDGFHQARALLIARKLGIEGSIGAVSAETNWILLPTFWVREWFGLPYDAFFR